jgi:hypothetical protein
MECLEMQNDTGVFHALDDYGNWLGMGTRDAITARRLHAEGDVLWCPKEWLVNGWRDRDAPPPKRH